MESNKCRLCDFKAGRGRGNDIASHVRKKHGFDDLKTYHDKHVQGSREAKCVVCEKPSIWNGRFYLDCCSDECKWKNLSSSASKAMRVKHEDPEFKKLMSYTATKRIQDQSTDVGFFDRRTGKATHYYYGRTRYRSNAEIKVAKALRGMGYRFSYEPKIFCYDVFRHTLVDFYLPDVDLWLAVKTRNEVNADVLELIEKLRQQCGINIQLLVVDQLPQFLAELAAA